LITAYFYAASKAEKSADLTALIEQMRFELQTALGAAENLQCLKLEAIEET